MLGVYKRYLQTTKIDFLFFFLNLYLQKYYVNNTLEVLQ